jgi:hypothetical protein
MPRRDVVVIDEGYATPQFTRLRGRGPRGERVVERVPHGHWKTLTMLGAITVEGVLAAATIDQATNAEVFATFVQDAFVRDAAMRIYVRCLMLDDLQESTPNAASPGAQRTRSRSRRCSTTR